MGGLVITASHFGISVEFAAIVVPQKTIPSKILHCVPPTGQSRETLSPENRKIEFVEQPESNGHIPKMSLDVTESTVGGEM